ncbi:MAG: hypothetical protein PHF30_04740 [Bacilli bacterium]|nr:hypothetical protein [Bacilli bacterium]
MINLINGSGADLIPTLCQALNDICIGYMFVILFLKGKSLIPCMITHSLIDITSTFSNNAFAQQHIILISVIIGIFALSYGVYLSKRINNNNL